ncbi:hypothetical protein HDU98_008338 [Podochytrium sp. JEL0797]|nr:hypothetical protein HDU98_008338 [Podochytrium sp. JEL0797]
MLLLAALALVQGTLAFTNGTLLPPYLCGPPGDGMPKSLGGVLNFAVFNKDTPLAFNPTAGNNLMMTAATMNTAPVNTAFMLASFHNTINSIAAMQNVITVAATAPLTAGAAFAMTLSSRGGIPLDGTMIYAQDMATGARLGSFTDTGATFSPFPGCGQDANGNNFGMVHHQIVSATGTYTQLAFNAPAALTAGQVIAIKGLAVDDMGFGFHCTMFTVGSAAATNCQVSATGAVLPAGAAAAAGAAAGAAGASASAGAAGAAAAGGATGAAGASSAPASAAASTTKATKAAKTSKSAKAANATKAAKSANASKPAKTAAKATKANTTNAAAAKATTAAAAAAPAVNQAAPAAGLASIAGTGGIAVFDQTTGSTNIVPVPPVPAAAP